MGKAYKLKVTQEKLVERMEASFRPVIWRMGMNDFYVINEEGNKITVSDKGRLETKFILELDEQKKLLHISTKTFHNLYILIPFTILGLLFFQSIDGVYLSFLEGAGLLIIITIAIIIFSKLFSFIQFMILVGKLKNWELIE